jgi:hypothetical protein
MAEVKRYASGFIETVIAVVIVVGLIPTLLYAVGNVTGVALLSTALVGTIIGAGVLLFLVSKFI